MRDACLTRREVHCQSSPSALLTVDFFSAEGHFLGNKRSLELEITEITDIPIEALHGQSLSDFSASERFAWAENRETTEEEHRLLPPGYL